MGLIIPFLIQKVNMGIKGADDYAFIVTKFIIQQVGFFEDVPDPLAYHVVGVMGICTRSSSSDLGGDRRGIPSSADL